MRIESGILKSCIAIPNFYGIILEVWDILLNNLNKIHKNTILHQWFLKQGLLLERHRHSNFHHIKIGMIFLATFLSLT